MGYLRKKAGAASVIMALGAGTAAGIYAYQSDTGFTPSGEAQKLHANKVDFSQDEDVKRKKSQENGSDKEKSAMLDQSALEGTDAAYLFSQAQLELPPDADNEQNQTVILNSEQPNDAIKADQAGNRENIASNITGNNSTDNVYNVTGDKSNADIIIGGNDKPGGVIIPSAGTGDGNGNGGLGNDNDKNDGSGGHKNDSSIGKGDKTDNDGKDDDKNDNTGGGTTPVVYPSDKVTNPPPKKNNPENLPKDDSKNFNESDKDLLSSESKELHIDGNALFNSDSYYIYKDQTITETDLMCALDTYIVTKTGEKKKYYMLGLDDLDKYIRFTGVSFDGGKTWNSRFPVRVPKDADISDMYIEAEYRFSQNDEWQKYEKEISYPLTNSRLYVLSKALTDSDEQINMDNVINLSKYDVSRINLYYYQQSLLGGNGTRLTQLFPGWMERGKLVDWNYEVTAGRHILEPADMVDLPEQYEAQIKLYWIQTSESVSEDLVYLQTLTGINGQGVALASAWNDCNTNAGDFVKIPDYIQAVDITTRTEVGTLSIPDSVIQIDNDSKLRVNDGYVVSDDNENYSSVDGILCDKDGSEMIAIPYNTTELKVSSDVKKVNISDDNNIKQISFAADSLEEYPEIEIGNLHDCSIVVRDDLMDGFLKDNVKLLNNSGNKIESDTTGESISVENGVAVNDSGQIEEAVNIEGTSLKIASNITSIKANAFESAGNLNTLVFSDKSQAGIKLEKGCFDGSSIKRIICSSRSQKDNLEKQLDTSGKTDIQLILASTMSGFTYYESNDGEIELVEAPAGITEFDGVIKSDKAGEADVHVTGIGDQAFMNCDQLKWVTLPEDVTSIGYRAFDDCDSLEGVLIQTKDHITIGNEAFDDCESLRFVASNAMSATMVDDYNPQIYAFYPSDWIRSNSFFFVPEDAEGYGNSANKLWGYDAIVEYNIRDVGGDGKVLYGTSAYGEDLIAIRSGKEMPDRVELPEETAYIYDFAFADAVSESGRYEINWQDIDYLLWIGSYSFRDSQLGGDIVIGDINKYEEVDISEGAFLGCEEITSVEIQSTLRSLGMFVFKGCKNMNTLHICSTPENNIYFWPGIFEGCDSIGNLILDDPVPPDLVFYGQGTVFRFNYDWTEEEEAEKLRISVPKGSIDTYIKAWRYKRMGYTGWPDTTEYLEMWNDVRSSMIQTDFNTGDITYPEDEEVDAEVRKRLLESENLIRTLLGAKNVTEPTDFYQYRLDDTMLTLISVPSYVQDISVDGESIGLPDGWYLDYIGTGAFSGASKLANIEIPDNLVGIQMNAFAGASADVSKLTLTFTGETPPQLLGATPDVPFLFGQTDDRIQIKVPQGCEEAYIDAWKYPMAGYEDETDLIWSVMDEVWSEIADDQDFDLDKVDEMINSRMKEILTPAENRLRSMMGLEPVNTSDDTTISDTGTENVQENSVETDDMKTEDTEGDTE
ncbi:leucine-rich repeat protein [Agathobacter sp.]